MADTTPTRDRWASRPLPPPPASVARLIRDGVLDAELAATCWALLDAGVPLVVASPTTAADAVLRAILDLLPSSQRIVAIAGAGETFDWMPQAGELGWSTPTRAVDADPVRADGATILVTGLGAGPPDGPGGDVARLAVRAAIVGYGLAATMVADSLEAALDRLRRPPVRLDDDERSRLGVVLVVREVEGVGARVVAAHYIRPTARDVHGHVQRLGPAVLATWDPDVDAFEHFGWGIVPELATRIGARPGDLELDLDERQARLEASAGAEASSTPAPTPAIAPLH